MDVLDPKKLALFLFFVLPGFISLKVYDLLIPSERRDFSKSIVDAVCYSALNTGVFLWPIMWARTTGWFYAVWIAADIIAPAFWPFLFRAMASWPLIAKQIVHPVLKPWDWFFQRRECTWVVVHLKDGTRIGGRFAGKSFASSHPAEEQIYLEEGWELDDNATFIRPIPNSKGVWIPGREIRSVEFYEYYGRSIE